MTKKYNTIMPEMVKEVGYGLIQDLGLENQIKFDTNKEKLMYALSNAGQYANKNTTQLDDVLTGFVTREFENQLRQAGHIIEDKAQNTLRFDLIRRIANQGFTLNKEKQDLFLERLSNIGLNHDVMKNLYGFERNCEKNYNEVANELNRSRERIRQIDLRSIKELRTNLNARMDGFNLIYGTTTDIKEELLQERIRYNQEELQNIQSQRYRELNEEGQKTLLNYAHKNPQLAQIIPVNNLELSIRAQNCLKDGNIKTLGQLTQINEIDLLKMKNMRRKSLNEIKYVLKDFNLELKE